MTSLRWFSAKLRYALFVGAEAAETLNDRLYIFREENFVSAFNRALNIGKEHEETYKNSIGDSVIWKFIEIISIDIIISDDVDGAEIHSELIHLLKDQRISQNTMNNPSLSRPIQTI